MDILLVLLSIAAAVFAGVMLLLASRTKRMEQASDARVHELEALATGSVLFGASGPADAALSMDAPLVDDSSLRLQSQNAEFDLAWDEMVDENETNERVLVLDEVAPTPVPAPTQPAPPAPAAVPQPSAFPFVLTVPASAGAGRVFSFARTERRSRT